MTTHQPWLVCFVAAAAMSLATEQAIAQTTGPPPLQLESKITLGDVRGRIDLVISSLGRSRNGSTLQLCAITLTRLRQVYAELGGDDWRQSQVRESYVTSKDHEQSARRCTIPGGLKLS